MPFDFTMYLIKADDCGFDDVTKPSASDINNNDEMSRNMTSKIASKLTSQLTSEPIMCIPGNTCPKKNYNQCPVNVFSFKNAHIFNKELATMKQELENLKHHLQEQENHHSEKMENLMNHETWKMDKSSDDLNHCFHGNINIARTVSSNNNVKRTGIIKSTSPDRNSSFTAMLSDFNASLEVEYHDEEKCFIAHCHMCKGPRRALSIDSAKWRHRVRRQVSFADDNGMPLTKVRVMPIEANSQRPPSVGSIDIYGVQGKYKQLRLDFPQPAADFTNFLDRLRQRNVSLENVKTDGTSFLGTVRVKNLAMEKDVRMRFTTDNWMTWTDIVASYVFEDATSCYDLFGFHVSVGHLPDEVQFAICYRVREEEHWDNNDGKNYRLKMISH